MINIVFANCEPITAYGEKTDQEKEGQKCKKIMFNGKINNFQSYYNAHDKQARGFSIKTDTGHIYNLGYTPPKFTREQLKDKAEAGEID